MPQYLLTCECGTSVAVDVGQAGERIACPACSAQLDVPTLRKLRHLPPAETESAAAASTWSARKGLVTASLLLAAVLAVVALWNRFTEPPIPEFDPVLRLEQIEHGVENLTPVEGWSLWVDLYRPMAQRGFAIMEDPHKPAIEQYITRRRFFQNTLLAVAALCAVVALTAIFWPRQSPRRTRQ